MNRKVDTKKSTNLAIGKTNQNNKKPPNAKTLSSSSNKKNTTQSKNDSKPSVESKKSIKSETKEIVPSTEIKKYEMNEIELKEHKSAIKIQCEWRRYKSKEKLKQLKKEKFELDEKLRKLEHEAFVQMVKIEQEREEKKRIKQLKEKQMKQKREARRVKFLEAAYDGNLEEIKNLISDLERELDLMSKEEKQVFDSSKKKKAIHGLIECKDSNSNTALSEASAGGGVDVVKFLLKNNADPNTKGAFGRTPLWRSAFAGHLDCIQALLENGADLRIYSVDGQKPLDIATKDNVIDLLKNWNIQLTDRMLEQIEKTRQQLKKEQMQSLETLKKSAQQDYKRISTKFELVKNELYKCNCELQRLHDEYLLNEQMYAPLIEQKEAQKVDLKIKYEDLRENCVKARITYKDILSEIKKEKSKLKKSKCGLDEPSEDSKNDNDEDESKKDNDNEDDDDEDDDDGANEESYLKINIKEMDDIILRDLSGILKSSEDKWPLIIDQNDQASTFLRYRDTNYVNCLDTQLMKPDKFRLALIGSIRFGKPFVIDLMQYDQELIESVNVVCDQIDKELFNEILNKSLMKNERYLRLANPSKDGVEYDEKNFNEIRIKNFKILFLTSNPYPSDKILQKTLPIKILTSTKSIDTYEF